MNRLFCLCILFVIISCTKNENNSLSEARYKLTVTGNWASPSFAVPPGAHFTTFAGMVHEKNASLWKAGQNASPGVEMIAEIGNLVTAFEEIDAQIAEGKASSLLAFVAPSITGTITTNLYANTNFTAVSFASMIAPSPDWFIGLSGFELYRNGAWITDTTIQLYAYDAGTEDGDIFSTNNQATVPIQPIKLLTPATGSVLANGNSSLGPIATVRLTKL
jgi:hypothetical protein